MTNQPSVFQGVAAAILDRISPDEADHAPSDRTWARIIQLRSVGGYVLELRDPNSGLGGDPAEKPRHQYLVARDAVWERRLPPAPLDQPSDETPWRDGTARWTLIESLPSHSIIREWAEHGTEHGTITQPEPVPQVTVTHEDIDGTGARPREAYLMPPADPVNPWADITSYPQDGHIVRCPVAGCRQHVLWYEAGYVPGYRVCMAPVEHDADDRDTFLVGSRERNVGAMSTYDRDTIRHRFLGSHEGEGTPWIRIPRPRPLPGSLGLRWLLILDERGL